MPSAESPAAARAGKPAVRLVEKGGGSVPVEVKQSSPSQCSKLPTGKDVIFFLPRRTYGLWCRFGSILPTSLCRPRFATPPFFCATGLQRNNCELTFSPGDLDCRVRDGRAGLSLSACCCRWRSPSPWPPISCWPREAMPVPQRRMPSGLCWSGQVFLQRRERVSCSQQLPPEHSFAT